MTEYSQINGAYEILFVSALLVIGVLILLGLIRAIKGPLVADRIVAINMVGTLTMVAIAILAIMFKEGYLVDVCLIYALLSFIAVIVLTKVYLGIHERKLRNAEKAQGGGEK